MKNDEKKSQESPVLPLFDTEDPDRSESGLCARAKSDIYLSHFIYSFLSWERGRNGKGRGREW